MNFDTWAKKITIFQRTHYIFAPSHTINRLFMHTTVQFPLGNLEKSPILLKMVEFSKNKSNKCL